MSLAFEFGHDIAILKMAIFDKADYIEIEPELIDVIWKEPDTNWGENQVSSRENKTYFLTESCVVFIGITFLLGFCFNTHWP